MRARPPRRGVGGRDGSRPWVGLLLVVQLSAGCAVELPTRVERRRCGNSGDCAAGERCAELAPGEPRCYPPELVCGSVGCPEVGPEPLFVPEGADPADAARAEPDAQSSTGPDAVAAPGQSVGPPDASSSPAACPPLAGFTVCEVDDDAFCVWEAENRLLEQPCRDVCDAAGLDCAGTALDEGELCDVWWYDVTCDLVGASLACVCDR